MNNDLIEIINNVKPEVQDKCRKYGIYGNVVYYDPYPSISEAKHEKLYIVAGNDPRIENDKFAATLKPDEIIRRNERTEGLFYTDLWAWDMTEGSPIDAYDELMEYGNRIEFLSSIYAEFNTDLPEKIWDNEINVLLKYYEAYLAGLFNKNAPYKEAKEGLDKFFKNEKNSGKLNKEWLEYSRSDRFPIDESLLKKIINFFNRKSNVIELETLVERSNGIKTLEMDEFEYKVFAKKMQEMYPEVTFAISDISVIDHGGLGTIDKTTVPPTKYVSQEEFAVTLKNRFAQEGWNCISDLNPCYWEIRKVHYRAVDEPIIARVYNAIAYQYTNSLDQQSIDYDGDIQLYKVSKNNFMNFVSEAKAQNLRYHIDFKGEYSDTSLDFLNVIIRRSSEAVINDVFERMIEFKAENDHKLSMIMPSLSQQIDEVKSKKALKEISKPIKKEIANETEDKFLF